MLPLIPFACIASVVTGGIGLGWYYNLEDRRRQEADQYANRLAYQIYRTSVANLTNSQASHIAALLQQQMGV